MHVRHAIKTADVTMAPGFPVRVVAASPTEASVHAAIVHTDAVIAGPVPPGEVPVSACIPWTAADLSSRDAADTQDDQRGVNERIHTYLCDY